MSVEDYSRKTSEYEQRLMKYKQNIEKFLANKSGVVSGRPPPASDQYNSTLFKAMPEESLIVSETQRGSNETTLLPQSNLLQSNLTTANVASTRERNLLSEIDQVMNRIKSKAPAIPAEAMKKLVEKDGDFTEKQPSISANRRPPNPLEETKHHLREQAKSSSKSKLVPERVCDNVKSEIRHPSSIPLPPPFKPTPPTSVVVAPPVMSRQKEALKATIGKYHQLSSQPPMHQSASNIVESQEQLFDLSQTVDQRSVLSELQQQHSREHEVPEFEDSVLMKLYREKEHLLQEIATIDREIEGLQSS